MSNTPRTDAFDDERAPDTNGHEGWKVAYFSMLTFARQLERELTAARQAAIAEIVAKHRKRSEKLAEEYGYTEGDTNAFVWRNKEAEWVAITLDELADDLERLSTLPPTHQVVPVEPTEEMLIEASHVMFKPHWGEAKSIYQAMLDAARKA